MTFSTAHSRVARAMSVSPVPTRHPRGWGRQQHLPAQQRAESQDLQQPQPFAQERHGEEPPR